MMEVFKINTTTKKIILIAIAVVLFTNGMLLSYFQFFGSKIVVEPRKTVIVVPATDIDEGVVLDDTMITYAEIYQKDYDSSITDIRSVLGFKTLIKLKKDMHIFPHMLQPPKEQHKPGYFTVSIDMGGITNTVANQLQKTDYVNLMLTIDKSTVSKKVSGITYVVLAKRKILELVNSAGIPMGSLDSKKEFKTQYIIVELNMADYTKYKAASMYARKHNCDFEMVLCDPTQEPMKENFDISMTDEDIQQQVPSMSISNDLYMPSITPSNVGSVSSGSSASKNKSSTTKKESNAAQMKR